MTSRSFYATPETERLINRKAAAERGGISDLINQSVQRLDEIVARYRPRLSKSEWLLIFDSLNGTLHSHPSSIQGVWVGIYDSIRLDGLDHKWNVDGQPLIGKLQALGFVESVAVVETAELYWAGVSGGETETQIFNRLGFQPEPAEPVPGGE